MIFSIYCKHLLYYPKRYPLEQKKPLQEYARWSGFKIEYKSFTLINTFYEHL